MNIATMPKDSSHRRNDIEQPLEEAAAADGGDADADADKSENTNKTSDSTASVSRKSSSKQRMSTGGGSKATANSRSVVVPLDPSILELVSKMDESLALDDEDDDEDYRRCCRNYHHCCWCVADVRRVSLIANFFYMITCVVFVWMVSAPESMGLPGEYEDDEFQEWIDSLTEGTIPRSSVGLIMAVIGSVGAYRFQKWLVLAMCVWYGIYLVLAILADRIFTGVFAALLLYPTIALFMALHHGKLTKENYSEESRCCSLLHNSKTNYDD